MEQRLSLITLGVGDLARAIRFYEGLGWSRSMRGAEGVAFFQAGGMAFGLYPLADMARDAGLPEQRCGYGGISLAYNTRSREEVDTVLDEAAAAGGTVIKRGHEVFWGGYLGYFTDPDGFLWEVAWNPGFTIDDAGNITLPD